VPDAASILAELVGHRSVAGESNLAIADHLAMELSVRGAPVVLVPGTRPDARNLLAVAGPGGAPDGLLLSAHCDVVATDGQPWSGDPFVLREVGDRLVGRGAADMKGFLACVLAALTPEVAARLRRPLYVAISHDEELGCAGVGPLLDHVASLAVPPARAIVGEPTGLRVATSHSGKAALRATVSGRAAHSSTPHEGVNAVAWASRLVVALLALQDELPAGTTIGIGPIAGGVRVNIVPDRCTVELEVRALPRVDPADVVARIEQAGAALTREMAPGTGIAFEQLAAYPGLAAEAGGFAGEVAALAGDGGEPIALAYGTEAGLWQRRLGIPVVVCGPGDMAQAHRADESIGRDELAAGEAFVARLLEDLCR
jgi:acetylornithine deacetylase